MKISHRACWLEISFRACWLKISHRVCWLEISYRACWLETSHRACWLKINIIRKLFVGVTTSSKTSLTSFYIELSLSKFLLNLYNTFPMSLDTYSNIIKQKLTFWHI
jgi:hypothetical protein